MPTPDIVLFIQLCIQQMHHPLLAWAVASQLSKMAPNQKKWEDRFPSWLWRFLVPLSFKNKTESKLYLFRKYVATNQWNMEGWHHLVRLWEIPNLPTSNHVGTLRTWMWASLMKLSTSRVQQIADRFTVELIYLVQRDTNIPMPLRDPMENCEDRFLGCDVYLLCLIWC